MCLVLKLPYWLIYKGLETNRTHNFTVLCPILADTPNTKPPGRKYTLFPKSNKLNATPFS